MQNIHCARLELQDRLRRRLAAARNEYEAAKLAALAASELQSQAPSPDGAFAFHRALRAERRALNQYRRMLGAFSDLVLHNKVPENGPKSNS